VVLNEADAPQTETTAARPTVSRRVHGLDTLRSVAIIAVMLFHASAYHGEGTLPDWLVPVARLGWMGVDLFFVLSGYLITSQLMQPYLRGERPGLWAFYRNRLFRVLPAYLVVLAMYYWMPDWNEDPGHLSSLGHYLTFTYNLLVDYAEHGAFSHAWSLCVEEHFYLLLPVIVLVMMRRPSLRKTVMVMGALVLMGIAVRSYFLLHALQPLSRAGDAFGQVYIERIYYPTYSRLDGLLAGVALALVKAFRPTWWNALAAHGHALLTGGVALVGVSVYLFKDRWETAFGAPAVGVAIGFPLLAVGFAMLVACALSANGLLRWKAPGAQLIATLAYSLYLTSKEMIHLVDDWFPKIAEGHMATWLAAYAACSLIAATMLYWCVEKPFLMLRDRRGIRGQGSGVS
jgi:peptidoglycan/LPS O-acetylase OafA/YrhL